MTADLPRRLPDEQRRLDAVLGEMFEHRIAFHEVVGFRLLSTDPAAPRLGFGMRPSLVGSFVHGRLHGGVISTALDAAGGLAVMVGITEKYAHEPADQVVHRFARVGTIDLRCDFLHPGLGREFVACGRIVRLGGRIASVQMTLENEAGILIATGSAAYTVS